MMVKTPDKYTKAQFGEKQCLKKINIFPYKIETYVDRIDS